jgi:uncharacterized cupredoxin-like copper-binding protein
MLATIAASSLVLAACVSSGNDASVADSTGTVSNPRTVEISMIEMAFEPATLTVATGETIRFVFTNNGKVRHEAVFGDDATQQKHEDEMTAKVMGDTSMGGNDKESEAVSLEPGATGEFVMTFGSADVMIAGCHEPGHWTAGMRLDITVE